MCSSTDYSTTRTDNSQSTWKLAEADYQIIDNFWLLIAFDLLFLENAR